MSRTITIRLTEEIAEWLKSTAKRTGRPQGRIIREQLEKARDEDQQAFLKLAGVISGPKDLSARKGFSRK